MLESRSVLKTITRLQDRIEERFPGRGLSKVCAHLLSIGRESEARVDWLERPIAALRASVYLLSSLLVLGVVAALVTALGEVGAVGAFELVQVAEAGINDVVFVGIAIFFLLSIERRVKRSRALHGIQQLRSIAHIIDMHQLTKDPARNLKAWPSTDSSPRASMTTFELQRYLDYCSEMLSLTGKLAVLYMEHYNDPSVLSSVNEVELLTTGLSRKVWQKLMILEAAASSSN